ncbi:MAG: nucleoside triphosphate pyrophosphohydrolase [Kofleriaceae bacterium]|jgi:MazG family protein|nr:nucleoside triphosphate pyrophosphohydrolase [Kofleriaceae bacterium]MBP9203399.1 nucleoside triphosphate pyrophosphohydrolase [Kofleriaceae bacterium]
MAPPAPPGPRPPDPTSLAPALGHRLPELCEVMARLLAPDGCPWDREQTLTTLRPFLVEETYEVLDALERGDVPGHREELGDLLMQVVFHSALRQAQAEFDVDDVIAGIVDKLVRRHPHVFAPPGADLAAGVETSAQVLAQWEEIKAQEKKAAAADPAAPVRTLAGVLHGAPGLVRAQKIGNRVGKVGFDWPGWSGSLAKVREEVAEVEEAAQAGDVAAAHREIGDLLFAVVNVARKLKVDAEQAMGDACARFGQRFELVEDLLRERGKTPSQSTLEEMDTLWNEAKRRLAAVDPGQTPPSRPLV